MLLHLAHMCHRPAASQTRSSTDDSFSASSSLEIRYRFWNNDFQTVCAVILSSKSLWLQPLRREGSFVLSAHWHAQICNNPSMTLQLDVLTERTSVEQGEVASGFSPLGPLNLQLWPFCELWFTSAMHMIFMPLDWNSYFLLQLITASLSWAFQQQGDPPKYQYLDPVTSELLMCDQCPPGTAVKTHCTADAPTECQACPEKHFAENWHWGDTCQFCTSVCMNPKV